MAERNELPGPFEALRGFLRETWSDLTGTDFAERVAQGTPSKEDKERFQEAVTFAMNSAGHSGGMLRLQAAGKLGIGSMKYGKEAHRDIMSQTGFSDELVETVSTMAAAKDAASRIKGVFEVPERALKGVEQVAVIKSGRLGERTSGEYVPQTKEVLLDALGGKGPTTKHEIAHHGQIYPMIHDPQLWVDLNRLTNWSTAERLGSKAQEMAKWEARNWPGGFWARIGEQKAYQASPLEISARYMAKLPGGLSPEGYLRHLRFSVGKGTSLFKNYLMKQGMALEEWADFFRSAKAEGMLNVRRMLGGD